MPQQQKRYNQGVLRTAISTNKNDLAAVVNVGVASSRNHSPISANATMCYTSAYAVADQETSAYAVANQEANVVKEGVVEADAIAGISAPEAGVESLFSLLYDLAFGS